MRRPSARSPRTPPNNAKYSVRVIWVPIGAWAAAAAVAIVVLGFCAYELTWKTKRLRGDLRRLQALADDTERLRIKLAATQQRIAATGLR